MTRTPLSRSKGQSHQTALLIVAVRRQAAAAVSVGTCCYVAVCRRGRLGGIRRFGAHRGRRVAGGSAGFVKFFLGGPFPSLLFPLPFPSLSLPPPSPLSTPSLPFSPSLFPSHPSLPPLPPPLSSPPLP